MKETIKEYTNWGLTLDFIFSFCLIFGSFYVYFALGRSGWWIVLGILLAAGVGFPKKKTEKEN